METVEKEGSQPPLDSSMAPALLFYSHGEPSGDTRFLYSIPKKRLLRVTGFGSLIKDVEWVTPQGWVLTLDPETRETSLRDPFFSSRAVRLPPDRENLLTSSKDTRCVLSTRRPTDPGCVVLAIHQTDPVLFYCRPGSSDRWSRHEYLPALLVDGDTHGRGDVIRAGGRFYVHIPWSHKVATLMFTPEPALLSSQVMDHCPLPVGCDFIECCLVESCEDLFLVQFCYTRLCDRRILRVELKKLDWSRSAFVKVADLGTNRVFFTRMGQFGASMAADELGLKPDCIYFSKSDDKGLYVYDMEQGTTSLYNPGQDVLQACWESILLMPAS